jgi:hypothetical protein
MPGRDLRFRGGTLTRGSAHRKRTVSQLYDPLRKHFHSSAIKLDQLAAQLCALQNGGELVTLEKIHFPPKNGARPAKCFVRQDFRLRASRPASSARSWNE